MPAPSGDITSAEAAALLGISRRSLYRWLDEGRIGYPLQRADIEARRPAKRPRGPRRNPRSARYVYGRHRYEEVQ